MAFVFRSERNFDKYLNIQNNYSVKQNTQNSKSPIKANENIINNANNSYNNILSSQNPPFLSSSKRNKSIKIEQSPGPGSYNISNEYYNKHKQFSSRQENSIPKDNKFFNLPILRIKEFKNDNPGPGYYNPSEKDLFGGKYKNNNKFLINLMNGNNNNFFNNISKSVSNIFIKKNNDKENSIDINNNLNKLMNISSAKKRIIENENNINKENSNNNSKSRINSGVIFENASLRNIRSPISKHSYESDNNKKKNKIGYYSNISKISGLTLDTERTSINTSKLSNSQIRNKSSKILQKLNNQFTKKKDKLYNQVACLTEQNISINNNLSPIRHKPDKSHIFRNGEIHVKQPNNEQDSHNFYQNIKEFDKIINTEYYSQNPGPGYYDPINISNQRYYIPKNRINFSNNFKHKNMFSLIKENKMKTLSPDPGEYKLENNMIDNKLKTSVDNKMKSILFDIKKLTKLKILREKETLERNKEMKLTKEEIIEPKYENNLQEIYETDPVDYRKINAKNNLLFNFGSNDKRFRALTKPNDYPGPGEYKTNLYKNIEEKNDNIIEGPSFKELFDKLENKTNLFERLSFDKRLLNNPPVGKYNPDIISSIKYNSEYKNKIKSPKIHKNNINSKIEKLTLKKAEEIKEKEKKIISLLGPGKYYTMLYRTFNDINKPENNIRAPFGSNVPRKDLQKQESFPGPGHYDINFYYNWINKTYNILFY